VTPERHDRLQLGTIHADCVTFAGAIDAIADLVRDGAGGYVVTPNVDHVVLAEHSPELRAAYAEAALSLVDGTPLVWLSRLLGPRLPEKVSGSDLAVPLLERAARDGWRVYFLGGEPGVGQAAADRMLRDLPGLQLVGVDAPTIGFDKDPVRERAALESIRRTRADLVFMALGCPKQELLMRRWRTAIAPAVMLGVGATLDFLAGRTRRAPAWMSRWGVEWVYRLSQDPRRLAKRYLVRDLAFLPIVARMWRSRGKAFDRQSGS
jgi:N-acetylglucosaminyldiphosphoundecaprenol N-acetyl-beta-D-mannosaminyltransferase